jgi:hypothetical protein
MRNTWTDLMVQGSLWALGVSVGLLVLSQFGSWVRWAL